MEWSPPSEDEATRHLHAAFPSLQFTTDEDDDADCDVDISVDDIRLPSVKDAIQQSIDGALAKWEELLPISTMEVLRVTQQRAATQKIARLVLKDEPTTDVTDQKIQGIFRDLVTEDECLAARRPYLLHDSLYLLEVMHSSLASKKSQFLLVLGSTPLTALADAIYCRDYEYLKEFGLHSKMMYMAGQFFVDKRQPHHVDYSNDVRHQVCQVHMAKFVTFGDAMGVDDPMYYCDSCYFVAHYDAHGTLLPDVANYKVFPYYPDD
ncbi:hypothetical protein DYB31_008817 [Aphanomyces astaci]|uniref:snRNA-activating protein complex subunit 3 n=1 Tax=Aphanomyces astaci TaxID=112090 RepID=A0A397FXW8_APHAT|nr:hypothetical protein DYB31_008817 [Aphanomyces astaci]